MTNQPAARPGVKPPPTPQSTTDYLEASRQLQLDMAVRWTGNADKDFAALMTAYRKGAIAAARIELQHGTDPEMRRLAEQVVSASEGEIKQMQAWQAKHQ